MEQFVCKSCGSTDFDQDDGVRICQYCGSQYVLSESEKAPKQSTISLTDDVERLLKQCKNNPSRARKYASLILDIDPKNREAKKYL